MGRFSDKTLLITGGTGSFGQAFLDRLLTVDEFRLVRVFSRDELKQAELRERIDNPRVELVIGDVRDRSSVDSAMSGVDYVFHAAALKQVPSCEFFPMQAVMTNVLGSNNVIESAVQHGVDGLVALSTDKAVSPINTMGMTKGIMERLVKATARRNLDSGAKTVVAAVRYGNVMCSRGSVIPLFIEQIKRGRPVTITVPEMTRFLLPLQRAIDLVEFALQHARPGDLFIRKSPACTIGDLSKALHRLFDREERVERIGRRHGEKIFETLATTGELGRARDMGDYYCVPIDDRGLNYRIYFSEGSSKEAVAEEFNSHNTKRLDVDALCELLSSLPEVQAELESRSGSSN